MIKRMNSYQDALEAMYLLLDKCGENFWRDWIATDLEEFKNNKSTKHHLSAYGGMGSFNDVLICQDNGHNVSKQQEPFLQWLFNDLSSICYVLANSFNKNISIKEIERSMGNMCPSLQGWRCLTCEYSEVTVSDIESYIAYHWVRKNILKALESNELILFVNNIISLNIPGIDKERRVLKDIIIKSNIQVTNREGWLQPCPKCKQENTAVYRWNREKKLIGTDEFVPSNDNLKLKR